MGMEFDERRASQLLHDIATVKFCERATSTRVTMHSAQGGLIFLGHCIWLLFMAFSLARTIISAYEDVYHSC